MKQVCVRRHDLLRPLMLCSSFFPYGSLLQLRMDFQVNARLNWSSYHPCELTMTVRS